MTLAAMLLGLAALGGLTMVAIRLSGAPRPPTWLALVHGAIAVSGVALLAYAAVSPGIPQMAQVALGLFALAAVGGISIFVLFHLKNLPLPIPIVLGHGLLALSALTLLLYAIILTPSTPFVGELELPIVPKTTLPWTSAGGDLVLDAQPVTPPALSLSKNRDSNRRVALRPTLDAARVAATPGNQRGHLIDVLLVQHDVWEKGTA
jgi:hypothetical protein